MNFYRSFVRPLVFCLSPERAHNLSILALKSGFIGGGQIHDKRLAVKIAGLEFPNFLGLAAGFDKNAEVADQLLQLGFGFSEVGTVTPRPQPGNPLPRLFRLEEDEAVINRMGFNNGGHDAVHRRLRARKKHGIIGVNIGANKDSENRIVDYVRGIHCFYDVANFFVINISSPNTPGLRNLQARASLQELLLAASKARQEEKAKGARHIPVFLKIAPDLTEKELDDVAAELLSSDIDGLIVSNTTLARTGLENTKYRNESGGLSGRPLFERSTIILAKMRQRVGKKLPIIGVGGVFDAKTAIEKIKAGADLVEIYSSMVYEGADLAARILNSVLETMKKEEVVNIKDYRDKAVVEWAKREIPD
ncbi:quinone-dependent dihydroorotate dehydrogenase [uncultured Bartonella sp.]|uniref:quinone-dependent dihydroorotate dehydrogenase n=1 Tax=uncultured Bartonella sp. TaxID=104108 RepID=UPI0026080DDF|nr:quinone-dependent dihydroorotate dehydrogenase [uncultured Bartonella sp.]